MLTDLLCVVAVGLTDERDVIRQQHTTFCFLGFVFSILLHNSGRGKKNFSFPPAYKKSLIHTPINTQNPQYFPDFRILVFLAQCVINTVSSFQIP